MYKISEVAKLSKITVRTLHHYDEIGLLTPNTDSNGYRLYSDSDLLRLQQILFFRELDFTLKEIKSILDNPSFDREKALIKHKEILTKKKERLEEIIESVNKSLDEVNGDRIMDKEELFKGFSMKDINEHKRKYAKEVEKKYGGSSAYRESEVRTKNYSKEKWEEIMKESNDIYMSLAKLIGEAPESDNVQELIEKWRQHISKNYYNCTVEIFKGLGEMYISDERFTKNIDKHGKGLAELLSEGIRTYCEREHITE